MRTYYLLHTKICGIDYFKEHKNFFGGIWYWRKRWFFITKKAKAKVKLFTQKHLNQLNIAFWFIFMQWETLKKTASVYAYPTIRNNKAFIWSTCKNFKQKNNISPLLCNRQVIVKQGDRFVRTWPCDEILNEEDWMRKGSNHSVL